MTMLTGTKLAARMPEAVAPPAWVAELVRDRAALTSPDGDEVRVIEGGGHALVSASIGGAAGLSALDLQHRVCGLYDAVAARLSRLKARHAVRLWNFIPQIYGRMGDRDGGPLDRYMVFNAGRFAAYAGWSGGAEVGSRSATATGIGHSGSSLVVHCLAAGMPGTALENPRQVPAYRYSRRRGPMPPCFARATIAEIGGEKLVLVGGTSSVRGENSVHLGDLVEQTLETFHNLACLVDERVAARERPEAAALRRVLARYRTLRVYIVKPTDLDRVRGLVREYFPGVSAPEFCRADVCRRTLLVEIEGTAV